MTDRLRKSLQALGVRVRLTVVAVVVVGVVLLLGAVLLLELAEQRIEDNIGDGADVRAAGIAALVEAGALSDPLPGTDPDFLAQVVAGTEVIAADRILSGLPPLSTAMPGVGEQIDATVDDLLEPFEELGLEDEGPYLVVVRGVEWNEGRAGVIVAASLEPAVQARSAVRPVLGIGLPLLMLIVGATTWVLAGRALHPVETMRRDALEISAVDLDRRLTVPVADDEVRRLAVSLNEMLQRLHDAMERQRRFVSDASHELRSPLAAIRTMVDVTLDETDPSARRQVAADLAEEFERLERLVADLLVLAAEDEGAASLAGGPVDLDQIAGRIAAGAALTRAVAVDTGGISPVEIVGRPDRLERLVRNLVDNACRHARSMVWIETSAGPDGVVLRVSDDGPGVGPEDRERVFERFVRLDDSRSRDRGGAGLGLAVVRAVAEMHGAQARFVAPVHGGATVEVLFPPR